MKNIKEEISGMLYNFSYEVDSDHGDISLDIGILKYRKILLQAIEKMVERVVGADETSYHGDYPTRTARNGLRQQLREKFKEELK